jgi:hypothetical protein
MALAEPPVPIDPLQREPMGARVFADQENWPGAIRSHQRPSSEIVRDVEARLAARLDEPDEALLIAPASRPISGQYEPEKTTSPASSTARDLTRLPVVGSRHTAEPSPS